MATLLLLMMLELIYYTDLSYRASSKGQDVSHAHLQSAMGEQSSDRIQVKLTNLPCSQYGLPCLHKRS